MHFHLVIIVTLVIAVKNMQKKTIFAKVRSLVFFVFSSQQRMNVL